MAEIDPVQKAEEPQQRSPRSPTESPTAPAQSTFQQTQADIVAHQAQTTIEAAHDSEDAGYETDAESRASTSISSSVRDFAFENGRRYHKFREGTYQFPNDESEQEREDMKHAMVVNLCGGKLHYAPLENPQNIIDVGTGTGIWAIDMGDEYPSAQVLGIDLSPIQPAWVPPNVRFMVDDAESRWLHPLDSFDFIHIRHMNSSIKKWPKLLTEAYDHIQPGGWIELQELEFVTLCDDGTMKDDYTVYRFLTLIKEGLAVFGVDLLAMRRNAELLRDAGFVNVEEKVFKIPLGIWPRNKTMKLIGLYLRSVIYDGLQGIALGPFTRALKWTPEEVELFLVDVRKSLMDASTHSYLPFHVVYGQKPLNA
ncbi:S-adenosyl-L-methionine-dependent methyltransferase [Mollisia scopiformis]|uniref:S-adenosyl-L-methionine-dependent methyltransferase n=1 Tax=Mollisia scopiformis TaxID=149040 RepID=A0A132BAI1_MOLSC|nr:S-adenosyl-L-methionine-dependent methyltransferase [Mollisia scopiformis]KUJ08667.1 S-adenosyl-L-methionine-dependent methyltransferase [Mollisia scopiformis]